MPQFNILSFLVNHMKMTAGPTNGPYAELKKISTNRDELSPTFWLSSADNYHPVAAML